MNDSLTVEVIQRVIEYFGVPITVFVEDDEWLHLHTHSRWLDVVTDDGDGDPTGLPALGIDGHKYAFKFRDPSLFWVLRSLDQAVGMRNTVIWSDELQSPETGSAGAWLGFSGKAVVEIFSDRINFEPDWAALKPDVHAALGTLEDRRRRGGEDLASQDGEIAHSYDELMRRERAAGRDISSACDMLVRRKAIRAFRRRRAERIVLTTIDNNLARIKAKLWRPDGRLVSEMMCTT